MTSARCLFKRNLATYSFIHLPSSSQIYVAVETEQIPEKYCSYHIGCSPITSITIYKYRKWAMSSIHNDTTTLLPAAGSQVPATSPCQLLKSHVVAQTHSLLVPSTWAPATLQAKKLK